MPDKAIVIGIGHYPRLGANGNAPNNLPGAIRDAEDVADWLIKSAGAEVLKIISTGNADEPLDVQQIQPRPVLQDVHDAFMPFVLTPNHVSNRLYVYMAGHGIAPELSARCLIMADAVASVLPWIPNCEGSAWINWFASQTQFDELVLWMDCCGNDGLDYTRGLPPVMKTVSRAGAKAKVFMAFASPAGLEAYEGPTDNGVVRGYFTDRLLAGLRGGAVNFGGEIRSDSLANYLRNGSAVSSDGQTSTVPLRPPPEVLHQQDMLFATMPWPAYQIPIRDKQGTAPPDGTLIVAANPPGPFSQTRPVTGGVATFNLPVGLFKFTGPNVLDFAEIGAATPKAITPS